MEARAPLAEVVVVGDSWTVPDGTIAAVIGALQIQVDRDFAPRWHAPARLSFVGSDAEVPPGAWPIFVMDETDTDRALGWHTANQGQPYGRVFAATCQRYGVAWTVTLSHELLELLGNPQVGATRWHGGRQYALEACDPCEADQWAYEIEGVLVSDFVLPRWFTAAANDPRQMDMAGWLYGPRTLLAGGYCLWRYRTGDWQQSFAMHPAQEALAMTSEWLRGRPGSGGRSGRIQAAGRPA